MELAMQVETAEEMQRRINSAKAYAMPRNKHGRFSTRGREDRRLRAKALLEEQRKKRQEEKDHSESEDDSEQITKGGTGEKDNDKEDEGVDKVSFLRDVGELTTKMEETRRQQRGALLEAARKIGHQAKDHSESEDDGANSEQINKGGTEQKDNAIPRHKGKFTTAAKAKKRQQRAALLAEIRKKRRSAKDHSESDDEDVDSEHINKGQQANGEEVSKIKKGVDSYWHDFIKEYCHECQVFHPQGAPCSAAPSGGADTPRGEEVASGEVEAQDVVEPSVEKAAGAEAMPNGGLEKSSEDKPPDKPRHRKKPTVVIENKKNCINSKIKSIATLPDVLSLSFSNKDHGLGVFTSEDLPKGTILGPVEGEMRTFRDMQPEMDFTHIWAINIDQTKEETAEDENYICTEDETNSNWCR